MNMRILTPALAALALSAPALAEQPKGEEKLAEILEGRVAGDPQSCIPASRIRKSRIIDGTALVYEVGDTIYVNRTRNPEDLDDDDYLVMRRISSVFCSSTQVTTRQRGGNFYTGNIFLSDFVPYRRVREDG